MKSKGLLFIFVFVAGLAAYTYFIEIKGGEKSKTEKEEQSKVVTLKKDDIQKIEFKNKTAQTLLLEKVGENWQIKAPIQDLADADAMRTLLSSFESEKSKSNVVEGKAEADLNLKEFGLAEPHSELHIAASSTNYMLKIGSVKAYDGSVYARRNQELNILLLSTTWDSLMAKTAREMRDKSLLRIKDKPVFNEVKVSFNDKNARFNIHLKRRDGKWEAPSQAKLNPYLSPEKINLLVENFIDIKVADYSESTLLQDRKRYLSSAVGSVLLIDSKDRKYTLEIGAESKSPEQQGQFPVISSEVNSMGWIAQYVSDRFKKNIDDVLDPALPFKFNPALVSEFQLTQEGKSTVFKKAADGSWQYDQKPAISPAVEKLIKKASELSVLKFYNESDRVGLNNESIRMVMKAQDGQILADFKFWSKEAKNSIYPGRSSLFKERAFQIDGVRYEELDFKGLVKAEVKASPSPEGVK